MTKELPGRKSENLDFGWIFSCHLETFESAEGGVYGGGMWCGGGMIVIVVLDLGVVFL